jgi:hypothetical protein
MRTFWAFMLGMCACSQGQSLETHCSATREMREALAHPGDHQIHVAPEAKGVDLRNGWCDPSDIRASLNHVDRLKPFAVYSVTCRNEPRFNITYFRTASGTLQLTVEPYSVAPNPPREHECEAASRSSGR